MDRNEIPDDDYNAILQQIFQDNPEAIVTTEENIMLVGPRANIS